MLCATFYPLNRKELKHLFYYRHHSLLKYAKKQQQHWITSLKDFFWCLKIFLGKQLNNYAHNLITGMTTVFLNETVQYHRGANGGSRCTAYCWSWLCLTDTCVNHPPWISRFQTSNTGKFTRFYLLSLPLLQHNNTFYWSIFESTLKRRNASIHG